jgi:hypothetical protein
VLLPHHLGKGCGTVLTVKSERHGPRLRQPSDSRARLRPGDPGPAAGRRGRERQCSERQGDVQKGKGTPAPVRAHGPLLPSGPGGVDEMDAAGVRRPVWDEAPNACDERRPCTRSRPTGRPRGTVQARRIGRGGCRRGCAASTATTASKSTLKIVRRPPDLEHNRFRWCTRVVRGRAHPLHPRAPGAEF